GITFFSPAFRSAIALVISSSVGGGFAGFVSPVAAPVSDEGVSPSAPDAPVFSGGVSAVSQALGCDSDLPVAVSPGVSDWPFVPGPPADGSVPGCAGVFSGGWLPACVGGSPCPSPDDLLGVS